MQTEWIKWWKSKLAWTIIIVGIVAIVGAFLLAYFLPFPYNIIGAFLACVPSGIVIRSAITKKLTEIAEKNK